MLTELDQHVLIKIVQLFLLEIHTLMIGVQLAPQILMKFMLTKLDQHVLIKIVQLFLLEIHTLMLGVQLAPQILMKNTQN